MERDERYEVDNLGKLIIAKPQVSNDRDALIKALFERNGWTYELLNKISNGHYHIKLKNDSLEREYQIHLYHGNVRKEDPDRNREEKKIQLGGQDPRVNDNNSITIILGFYVCESSNSINDTTIIAWPVEQNKNYPDNPSLRVNMKKNVLPAKNIGFFYDNTTGKKLVAFRPEFIYYYLENYRKLHEYDGIFENQKIEVDDFDNLEDKIRNKYIENPYYKLLLKIKNFKDGDIEFRQNKVPSFVPVAINEKRYDPKNYFSDITPTGIFEDDFYFPAIIQGEVTWMSFAPHETETSEDAIQHATGNVVTYGCGLGYFPYMASLKEDVKSVTIIELDLKIIEFFKNNLLPLFEHKDKIKIINANAIEFGANPLMQYDYLFADIWHDVFDGLPFYLIFKKNEKVAKVCDYWIEKDMLVHFRRQVLSLIEEETLGYTDKDYEVQDTFIDRLLSVLHYHLKDKIIKNAAELEYFLSDEGLIDLIKQLPEVKI